MEERDPLCFPACMENNAQDGLSLDVFWAKFGNGENGALSLRQHLTDVSGVIVPVSRVLLSESRRTELGERCGATDLDTVLRFAGWAHDVGKASPFFQAKVPSLHEHVLQHGYSAMAVSNADMRALPHSLISAYTVQEWLKTRCTRRPALSALNGWFEVLGGHHGIFPPVWQKPDGLVSEISEHPEWLDARLRLLDAGAEHLGITAADIDGLGRLTWSVPEQAVVTGLLIAADWVGSNENNFPYDCDATTDQEQRAADGRAAMDLGGRWIPSPVDPAGFAARFGLPTGAVMRPVQRAVVETARSIDGPGLILVEDATGGGKTEAALMAADVWADRLGLDGIYFGQPTRVTSDAMFSRVMTWLKGEVSGGEVLTVLAHGKAEFNDDYRSLFWNSAPANVYDTGNVDVDRGPSPEANAWFRGRKTGMLASVVVGTIDQLLFAALRSRHVVLRHLGLVGKVVILDEVHAADDFMSVYLVRILEWLGMYGVPVIALSATLPPERRSALLSAYARGATDYGTEKVELEETDDYPRITWTDGAASGTVTPDPGDRSRSTHVEFLPGDLEETAAAIIDAAETGGCIAAICNTVTRAQRLFELLDGRVEGLTLLHSRFLADHRASLETELVDVLGRNGEGARGRGRVVVSTQIIEQGLDLDFDLMYSDIAPVDLLIQRMGRLHRHDFAPGVRPADKAEARFVITGCNEFDSTTAPEFPRGIEAVYRRSRLLRAVWTLRGHLGTHGGTVESPKDVAALVSAAYDEAMDHPAAWETVWQDAEAGERKYRTRQQEEAGRFCLPDPESGSLSDWTTVVTSDTEVRGLAQVRDADESVEVIVVQRRGDTIYALPHVRELAGKPLDGMLELDPGDARRLAQCSVRLPAWVAASEAQLLELEKDGQESWQASPWLKGVLPLVLDESFQRRLGDWHITYERQRGLLCERVKR